MSRAACSPLVGEVPLDSKGEVFSLARHAVKNSLAPIQKELALSALTTLQEEPEEMLPFIDLPLSVYAAVTGKIEPALPLAAATTLLFLGIDLLDDLADGDLPPSLKKFGASQVQLASFTLISSLPQIMLSSLPVSPLIREKMLRAIAEGLSRMSAGQEKDIAQRDATLPSSEQVLAAVVAKSGGELAMFAKLAALFAGASDSQVKHYEEIGQCLGTAGQLASDCHDIFNANSSKDLANGTRSYPLALYLEKKTDLQRQQFLAQLQQAQRDPSASLEVRHTLHQEGVLRLVSFIIEVDCQKALKKLLAAMPREPGSSALKRFINHISFYPERSTPWDTNKSAN